VSSRFINDLDLFNEWMDEVDYQSEKYMDEDPDRLMMLLRVEENERETLMARHPKRPKTLSRSSRLLVNCLSPTQVMRATRLE